MQTLSPAESSLLRLPRRESRRFKKSSSVTYQIYPHSTTGKPFYRLFYRLNGNRQTKDFPNFAKAKSASEQIDLDIANGRINAVSFSESQRNSHLRCEELAAPTGKPAELCIATFADLLKRTPAGHTVEDVFNRGLQNLSNRFEPKPLPELVPVFLAQKEADGISKHYLRNLEHILEGLAQSFTGPANQISAAFINQRLRGLKTPAGKPVSQDTRYHHRNAYAELFSWSKSNGYLPRTWSEMDDVPKVKRTQVEFEIFTNNEVSRLIQAAEDDLKVFFLLQFFAGIRHEEISKMDWADISLEQQTIYVRKGIAKTGRDRRIPILPNLQTWLEVYAQDKGPVCSIANPSNAIWRAKKRAGIPNGRDQTPNIPRKNFISNRLWITQNIEQVALEAGNSPQKIQDNYNRTPDPKSARAYFEIRCPLIPMLALALHMRPPRPSMLYKQAELF